MVHDADAESVYDDPSPANEPGEAPQPEAVIVCGVMVPTGVAVKGCEMLPKK